MVLSAAVIAVAASSASTREYILEKIQEYCPQALQCIAAWMAHGLPDATPPGGPTLTLPGMSVQLT